ncbi:MAG: aspartate aminotransferase family protein [Oligoflexia bacterium]|nr:aspartate aminotransferase family protein [Oligoflexia bacterium]
MSKLKTIDREKLKSLMKRETETFEKTHETSKRLFERAKKSLLGGVPMNWMAKWPGGFPLFVEKAFDAKFTDVDGNTYVDLCLGDTGSMTGHSPKATVEAVTKQLQKGITTMLPTENALWMGEELSRRFGLPYWQFALTATDANRFSIRLARLATGRKKILVFNRCYHGSVDETFITLKDGVAVSREGNIGPGVDPTLTTKVVEFNDVAALEIALKDQDVACVLTEPALTNVGIVHPAPGFHEKLRELTKKYGTLLIMDETHTICSGPGGYTRAFGLEPDILTLGKPIGGGIPSAIYGFSQTVSDMLNDKIKLDQCDTGGIGGTLAGNALSLAAMRATLENVLTENAFSKMIPLAERFTKGVQAVIEEYSLPWHVSQLGCRAEYLFHQNVPKTGAEAADSADFELERYMHLHALNRGVLLTPFHNMALMSPATTEADVDRHTEVFRLAVKDLVE